jgi:hypothetical protein
MTPDEIEAAVAKGIITPEQASALRAETAGRDPGLLEEPFAIVDNFGAIFICVGLAILQLAPWLFAAALPATAAPLLDGGFALIFWLLAEMLARGRRRLPATLAALLFVYNGYQALGALWLGIEGGSWNPFELANPQAILIVAVLLAAALVRFRLPLLVLTLALTLVALVLRLADAPTLWVIGGCGLALILAGVALDLRDPDRTGPWHEWAMWLFVVGSPLAVHALFVSVIRGRVSEDLPPDDAGLDGVLSTLGGVMARLDEVVLLVLLVAALVSFVGLLLDRRSLVASSLIYLAAAFVYALFRTVGDPVSLLGIIPLLLGGYVILLGVAWLPIRRLVLGALPFQELLRRLPRYG